MDAVSRRAAEARLHEVGPGMVHYREVQRETPGAEPVAVSC